MIYAEESQGDFVEIGRAFGKCAIDQKKLY